MIIEDGNERKARGYWHRRLTQGTECEDGEIFQLGELPKRNTLPKTLESSEDQSPVRRLRN